ncbi:MAG: MerR family transcriptional regulator [Proteobacteria bacterium]|nr:MerR family transcriptional regulator [Pseudomonadota bacterium]MBU1389715.1 MerR family transcriptional regulator [Pseudomonadota bacterium]MBU1542653.1 MerR family transcriptional regulator [Pseudomonadota bacterium]MBU2480734.1 MerR family transcriptional regulator [Pseudomonadota bacterium]
MEETVSISQASKESNFSERQLRSFEARGYIEAPLKVRCGSIQYRRYTPSHIQAIKIFKKYLDQGYKLAFASQKAFEELATEVKE